MLGSVGKEIDPTMWYSARDTAGLLGNEVTEATVKDYCKKSTLKSKRVGPKRRWMVLGSSIISLRKKWGLDQ